MKKNKEITEFKSNEEKISFKLEKVISPAEKETVVTSVAEEVPVSETVDKRDIEITQTSTDEYQVFDYMDSEDLLDMEEHLGDLSSLMLMLGSSRIEEKDIQLIAALLDALGKRLTIYTESYSIGHSLSDLSSAIFTQIERFKEIEQDLSTMSGAFISDLQTWAKMTFKEGAPSADFMNDTIVANTQTIISMLNADDIAVDESDMDDIFDF